MYVTVVEKSLKFDFHLKIFSSLFLSQWKMAESEKHELSVKEFNLWSSTHCPRLLDGLLHWITSSLLLINLEGEGQGAEPDKPEPTVRSLLL